MSLMRRNNAGGSAAEVAVDAAVELDDAYASVAAQLAWLETVLAPAEVARARDCVSAAMESALTARVAFDDLTRTHPPRTRLRGDAPTRYQDAATALTSAHQELLDGASQLAQWCVLPSEVPALLGKVTSSLNAARQACTAAAGEGRDAASWLRQVNRAQAQQRDAQSLAAGGSLMAARTILNEQLASLELVLEQALAGTREQAHARTSRGRVEELADEVRDLGQDALARWSQLRAEHPDAAVAPVREHALRAGEMYRDAVAALDGSRAPESDRVAEANALLLTARDLLTELLEFTPVPGAAPAAALPTTTGSLADTTGAPDPVPTPGPAPSPEPARRAGPVASTSAPDHVTEVGGRDTAATDDGESDADAAVGTASTTTAGLSGEEPSVEDRIEQILARVQASRGAHGQRSPS